MTVFFLGKSTDFPDPELADDDGLLAIGGDLSQNRLLTAYRSGIFPWYGIGDPLLWWSPNPRMVLFLSELHIPASMRKIASKRLFTLTINHDFEQTIANCATVQRPEGATWITADMITAYTQLHHEGYAHSVEAWYNERLVGGFYGISLGRCFFGESMFYTKSNASKFAFMEFAQAIRAENFHILDCQIKSPHLSAWGAREIPRRQFQKILSESIHVAPQRLACEKITEFFNKRNQNQD